VFSPVPVAHVAEDHGADVDRRAVGHLRRDVELAAIVDGALAHPGLEDRLDRELEALVDVLGEGPAGLLADDLQEAVADFPEPVCVQADVGRHARAPLDLLEGPVEFLVRDAQGDVPEALARLLLEGPDLGAHGVRQTRGQLALRRIEKGQAGLGRNDETRRDVQPDLGHLAEIRPLAAQQHLVLAVAFLKRKHVLGRFAHVLGPLLPWLSMVAAPFVVANPPKGRRLRRVWAPIVPGTPGPTQVTWIKRGRISASHRRGARGRFRYTCVLPSGLTLRSPPGQRFGLSFRNDRAARAGEPQMNTTGVP
jgi:hypothetical protein